MYVVATDTLLALSKSTKVAGVGNPSAVSADDAPDDVDQRPADETADDGTHPAPSSASSSCNGSARGDDSGGSGASGGAAVHKKAPPVLGGQQLRKRTVPSSRSDIDSGGGSGDADKGLRVAVTTARGWMWWAGLTILALLALALSTSWMR